MTAFALIDRCSGADPVYGDLPVFPDAAAGGVFTLVGNEGRKTRDFNERLYFKLTLEGRTTVGSQEWSASRTKLFVPGFSTRTAIAPSFSNVPIVMGRREAGMALFCIRGRTAGFPGPLDAYQWLRDGVAIPGATDQWYFQTSADVGAVVTCRMTAINAGGTNSYTVPGGSATTEAVLLPDAGTKRYMSFAATGTGDGSSTANAMALTTTNLNAAILAVGPGGSVILNADVPYPMTESLLIFRGGTSGSPVNIVGMSFATGREKNVVLSSTRSQPLDIGAIMVRGGTGDRGIPIMSIGSPYGVVTASAASNLIASADGLLQNLPAGTPLFIANSGSGSAMPAPLVANTVYYAIPVSGGFRVAATRADAIAGTAITLTTDGAPTLNATTCGDVSTATVNVGSNLITVSADLYGDTEDGDLLLFSTSGTLPTGFNGVGAIVKKLGSNTLRVYKSVIDYEADVPFVFADAGTGTFTARQCRVPVGSSYVDYRNITCKDAGSSDAAILQRMPLKGIRFFDVHGINVYRLFGQTNRISADFNDASAIGPVFDRSVVYGCERGHHRVRYHTRGAVFNLCFTDSRGFFNDLFPSLNVLQETNTYIIEIGDTTWQTGPSNTLYTNCVAKRAYTVYPPDQYAQGDGFESSGTYVGSLLRQWCEATWCGDGGFDDKATGLVYEDCYAGFTKRQFRLWNSATLRRTWSKEPQRQSSFRGENGGRCHFGIFRSNATMLFEDFTIIDASDADLFNWETGSTVSNTAVTFTNATMDVLNPQRSVFKNGASNTLTWTPAATPSTAIAYASGFEGGGVPESTAATGTVIATLSGADRFLLVNNPGGKFRLDGTQLKLISPLNYSVAASHTLLIRGTTREAWSDLSVNILVLGSEEAETAAFFDAAATAALDLSGVTPSYRAAVNARIKGYKENGLWDIATVIPLVLAPTTELAGRNLRQNAHHFTVHGGVTKTPKSLYTGDGTSGYLEAASAVPNALGANWGQNDAFIHAEVTSHPATSAKQLLTMGSGTSFTTLVIYQNATQSGFRCNAQNIAAVNNTVRTGDFFVSREPTVQRFRRHGGATVTSSNASVAPNGSGPLRLLANNGASPTDFNDATAAIWWAGKNLDTTQQANLIAVRNSFRSACEAAL